MRGTPMLAFVQKVLKNPLCQKLAPINQKTTEKLAVKLEKMITEAQEVLSGASLLLMMTMMMMMMMMLMMLV